MRERSPREETATDRMIARRDMYRGSAQIAREKAARDAAGIRAHTTDPTDPWADNEWRRCEADCPQHKDKP